jgi:hypothetical protein
MNVLNVRSSASTRFNSRFKLTSLKFYLKEHFISQRVIECNDKYKKIFTTHSSVRLKELKIIESTLSRSMIYIYIYT